MSSQATISRAYWNGRCAYCLGKFSRKKLTKEHIIPKSQPNCASKSQLNIVFVCWSCNHKRRTQSLNKFLDNDARDHIARHTNAQMLAKAKDYACMRISIKEFTRQYFIYLNVRKSFDSAVRLIKFDRLQS